MRRMTLAALVLLSLIVSGATFTFAQAPADKLGPHLRGLASPPRNVVPRSLIAPAQPQQPLDFGGPPYSALARIRFRALAGVIAIDPGPAVPTVKVLIETDAGDATLASGGAQVLGRVGSTVAVIVRGRHHDRRI